MPEEKENAGLPEFRKFVIQQGLSLRAESIETLQVNLGKLCNQACKHCHVEAGPHRPEVMSEETIEEVLRVVKDFSIRALDITGGAPELNPHFRYLVTSASSFGAHIIVRHNLTVMSEPGYEDLPEFFAGNKVEVVSSLPYFLAEQTDAQRGRGVFDKSIWALRKLNEIGYGCDNTLQLHLVFNPVGAFLPPKQAEAEADFKRELRNRYGISFNNLYVITNMPINRFLDYLKRSGNEVRYRKRLFEAFNALNVGGLMCKTLISVDWQGYLYDCDFNQMLSMPLSDGCPRHIRAFRTAMLETREIATGSHCYGCTAGAGSSCSGSMQ
jgi:radical SAM/Cys-rich protein